MVGKLQEGILPSQNPLALAKGGALCVCVRSDCGHMGLKTLFQVGPEMGPEVGLEMGPRRDRLPPGLIFFTAPPVMLFSMLCLVILSFVCSSYVWFLSHLEHAAGPVTDPFPDPLPGPFPDPPGRGFSGPCDRSQIARTHTALRPWQVPMGFEMAGFPPAIYRP